MFIFIMPIFSFLRSLKRLCTWPKYSYTSSVMVQGLWDQGIRPSTVIDVGANVGQFAVASWKILKPVKIYSFEPTPISCMTLKSVLRNCSQAEIFQIAVGDSSGMVKFNVNAHSHSNSIRKLGDAHLRAFPFAKEQNTIEVSVETLDSLMHNRQLVGPVLLKIDVQGYESAVIRGAGVILKSIDWILLEASFKPLYVEEPIFEEIQSQLFALGFSFLRPVGMLKNPENGEILQMDCLFHRRS